MAAPSTLTIDGNEAAARMAHLTNEVIAIYPITPASPMGEWSDEWSSQGRTNLWGAVPSVVEMQSEAGAAGAIHGALQGGALATTFTASQGLLLMLPNMYKIAGELSPTVFHIAARSLACQALSIFGDHSDVMAARATGFAMLASNSPQEVMDMALISQAVTLTTRLPVLHFFDGFRTSHEVAKLEDIDHEVVRALIDDDAIVAHRRRALSPEHPVLRGSSQNPDVYFQARESVNPRYAAFPGNLQDCFRRFEALTGRSYDLFEYVGHPQAERVLVLMGSGAETAQECVDHLVAAGERVGLLKVRLYRPFASSAFLDALPESVLAIAVLDRCKEPGADGEPLYKDVLGALARAVMSGERAQPLPTVVGGRFGLSSKEFTPGMVRAVLDELSRPAPKNGFTIGIHDDVSHTSLAWDEDFRTDAHAGSVQALFFGLGSDGTVSANKNTIKIIGEATELKAQGYFVYDSKKSGAMTVSHLRFGPRPIRSTYLIEKGCANFIACHQPQFLGKVEMLDFAADEAVFLVNSALSPEALWEQLDDELRRQIVDKRISLHCIDAYRVAADAGLGKRINTIMQTCFFAISGVLPAADAIAAIKAGVEKSYGRRGRRIVEMNFRAIDAALDGLRVVSVPKELPARIDVVEESAETAADESDFLRLVTRRIMAGDGDRIPVSALPEDGSFPLGTAALEKRNLALEIPVWDEALCTQCGKCVLVCPHAAIRAKAFPESAAVDAPEAFKAVAARSKDYPEGLLMSYQVAPEDCTGCTLCVDICPIRDKSQASHKALNMAPHAPLLDEERRNWAFFGSLPDYDRSALKRGTIPGAMLMQPLFEFSGACVGCGETPYLKLASQLFGDRMVIANATGCSSIYGGNLPTTPWTTNSDGRGPAWSNSLFEDNAEFALGLRLAIDAQRDHARALLARLRPVLNGELVDALIAAEEIDEASIHEQRERIEALRVALRAVPDGEEAYIARRLLDLAEHLGRKSVWSIGGDGWAYDIGYGGVDHVLASGADINILVLDTEVYSNTGGQTSKATPRGAVAKFSAAGKALAKKDLALLAMEYPDVYVAHVAYGAKDTQTLKAFLEAEAHRGPSLIIAFSPCIAHGVDLSRNHHQQDMAVKSGHWPLFRFDPSRAERGQNPLQLDSKAPSLPYRQYMESEMRFAMLWNSHPEAAEAFATQAQEEVNQRFRHYQQLAAMDWDPGETLSSARAQLRKQESTAPAPAEQPAPTEHNDG
ncbi:MAG: pyruvate:ferredoxin (flavodoxin) oxidoreductase [Halieaceae bacterium]|jgi:pyruvate-ferredoxin/flavodoxin oxidoreductase|nr:pyruvate:ferredoxin (flavodoxin) oxidoreductase [Halieaceae bacterium]